MPTATPDVEVLKVLAEQSTLDVVRMMLLDGPMRQRDFVARLDLSAVTVSRALGGLERAGIVETKGKRAPYSLVHGEKTRDLVQAAADLAHFIQAERHATAEDRSKALRKRTMERATGAVAGGDSK